MNPAVIFEAHHQNYVNLQSKDFAKTKMKNVIEKIWKILGNHQSTPKHALNVSMIQTHYANVMNGRFQT